MGVLLHDLFQCLCLLSVFLGDLSHAGPVRFCHTVSLRAHSRLLCFPLLSFLPFLPLTLSDFVLPLLSVTLPQFIVMQTQSTFLQFIEFFY